MGFGAAYATAVPLPEITRTVHVWLAWSGDAVAWRRPNKTSLLLVGGASGRPISQTWQGVRALQNSTDMKKKKNRMIRFWKMIALMLRPMRSLFFITVGFDRVQIIKLLIDGLFLVRAK